MNLKRISAVAFTALFILCSLAVNAQQQRFRIGMKGSLNMSWIAPSTKNISRVGSSIGYSYGLMGDFNFQKYYSLSTELVLTDISGSFQYTNLLKFTDPETQSTTSHDNVQYDYNMNYVQIPVSLKFKTKEFGYWTYWAQFGFAPSFLTKATADITGKTIGTLFDDPTDIRVNKSANDEFHFDNFKDEVFVLRFPLIIGAGIEYSLAGNTSLYTGIRFDNDFIDMLAADKDVIAKTKFVSLNVGAFF